MLEHVPTAREARELPAIEAAIEPHVERIRAAAADAFAPNTRRAYRTAWAAFARWADGEGFQAIPAAPAAVAAYLAARSEAGRSLSSLQLARQAIRTAHIEAGEASGGRAHRQSAGRDPRHGRRSPRGSHQPDGIPRSGPDLGSRGRRPRLGHAGRHAPALRSGRARMG